MLKSLAAALLARYRSRFSNALPTEHLRCQLFQNLGADDGGHA